MPNSIRVPAPNSPREIEDWRIRLAANIGSALTTSDVLGESDEIVVTINENGTITISVDSSLFANKISGTTNQITVTDDGDGTITISTPQDLDIGADVEFNTVTAYNRDILRYNLMMSS